MNNSLTEMIFLLDRSGSMAGLESDTIGGFNSLLERQCQLEGETKVTAVLFDDEYELLWDGVDAHDVKLTSKEYYVCGYTALLDAVGKTIVDVGRRLAQTAEEQRPGKVIFVITTDGMENASQEFTYDKVKKLITHQKEAYSWEFIFLGANIDVSEEADQLGIEQENAYSWEASEQGVEQMYSMLAEEIVLKRN